MKRTRAATKQAKEAENPDTPGPKKTKPEGPSRPEPELPRENPQPGEMNSSLDTSEIVRRYLTIREHLSPTEEDPSEDTWPPREEPQKSPDHTPAQRIPINPPLPDQIQPTPTSPEYTPASPEYTPESPAHTPTPNERTPSSAGSNNGYHSMLSVQIDNLAHRVYDMDQGIARRLCHSDQVSLNITANVDQLRATVSSQEDQNAQMLREMADLRSEQGRQRDEMRILRIEIRSIREVMQNIQAELRELRNKSR